ncbi:hypothetical protein QYE76_004237 [Lolium multiflorum]|uniref:Uncharacterized protein n=1 Tax=Lolium multiflorum TaxID=4521 RepID=A0AAD8RSU2_LOLMU|nr:hypothetical protein QYE76_004237 [Lolium multiflorum]
MPSAENKLRVGGGRGDEHLGAGTSAGKSVTTLVKDAGERAESSDAHQSGGEQNRLLHWQNHLLHWQNHPLHPHRFQIKSVALGCSRFKSTWSHPPPARFFAQVMMRASRWHLALRLQAFNLALEPLDTRHLLDYLPRR